MRYMGLDYGDKTIGVAVSDESGNIALGVETVHRQDAAALRASVRRIEAIAKEYGVGEMVLGYPKNMDNTETERCAVTLAFKEKLARNLKSTPVTLWDERLSTAAVGRSYNGGRGNYGRHVDEMAAVYILQGYLDYKNKNKKQEGNNGR